MRDSDALLQHLRRRVVMGATSVRQAPTRRHESVEFDGRCAGRRVRLRSQGCLIVSTRASAGQRYVDYGHVGMFCVGMRTARSEALSQVVRLLFHRKRILSQHKLKVIRFVKRSFRSPSRPTCAWSSVDRLVCARRVVRIQPQSKAGILGMVTWG